MKPDLFDKIADEYSLMILNWAVKKTGSRANGEDLAQEVLYQILSFVKNKPEIEKLDNLIWKIAHYTWCNTLRGLKKERKLTSLDTPAGLYIADERDYINELAEREAHKEELAALRRKVSDLSKVQRGIIIAYYLENLAVSDIAAKFGIKNSAVKWHLFDARKKLKEQMEERFTMKTETEQTDYIYKPGRLFLGSTGETGPDPDIKRVNDNLIRQNICLLCYGGSGRTLGELAEMTGIPKPYLEFDLDWLVYREFLLLENKRYITNFGIKDRRHFQEVRDIYISAKEKYYRSIIDYFNSREQDIRNIGFYGSDFDWNKLLWSLLTLYLRYFSESEPLKTLKKYNSGENSGNELHKDGGRYTINGFDQSENQSVDLSGGVITDPVFEPEKWNKISGIWCSSISDSISEFTNNENPETNYLTYWLGIYIFANSTPVITRGNVEHHIWWRNKLAYLLNNDFSAPDMTYDEKELFAAAVKENIIKNNAGKYVPQFTILSFEQFKKLHFEIFEPLVQLVKPQTLELVETFKRLNERSLPKKIQSYIQRWTYFDIWDSGIKNFMFAADEGLLYLPKTPEDGAALTLSFIY